MFIELEIILELKDHLLGYFSFMRKIEKWEQQPQPHTLTHVAFKNYLH